MPVNPELLRQEYLEFKARMNCMRSAFKREKRKKGGREGERWQRGKGGKTGGREGGK